MDLILLVAASLLFAFGGLFMKYSQGLTRPGPSVAVFALFCAGAASQAIAMKRTEMGVAYIFVLGSEAIAALLLSVFLLSERASVSRICAVVLIVAGIALLERT
jgi:small multidrug resistance pump/quaternary ammonium compound-resistance protein SugE